MVGGDLEEARQRGDGVAREIHIGQGLEEHDLMTVHLALPPQTLKLGLGDGDAPSVRQIVQRGKACVVAGAVVFWLRVAEAGNEPDVIGIHTVFCLFVSELFFEQYIIITYARAKRYTKSAKKPPCGLHGGVGSRGQPCACSNFCFFAIYASIFGSAQPSRLVWRSRAMPSACGGTSLVMVLPAAV